MPRFSLIQNNLNGGEFGRSMYGRTDIPKFKDALRILKNFIIRPQGGVEKRPGTKWVAEAHNSSTERVRLVPFSFSTSQSYILEFGDKIVKFFRNEADIDAATQTFQDANVDLDNEELNFPDGHFFTDHQGPFLVTSDGTLPVFGNGDITDDLTEVWTRIPQEASVQNQDAILDGFDVAATIDNTYITFSTAHGWIDGQGPFLMKSGGALPTTGGGGGAPQLRTDTEFYVQAVSSTRVSLHTTAALARSATDAYTFTVILGDTSVDHTIYPTKTYARQKLILEDTSGAIFPIISDSASGTAIHSIYATAPSTDPIHPTVAQLVTPYETADLIDLQFAQSADVLFIAHKDFPPGKIGRLGHATWTYDEIDFLDGPFLGLREGEVSAGVTMDPQANTGLNQTLTPSDTAQFTVDDIGRYVRIFQGTTWGYCEIKEVNTTSGVAIVDIREDWTANVATDQWHMTAWGEGNRGYPVTLSFFEQRLIWGGAPGSPSTFFGSKTASFEDMQPSPPDGIVEEDDGLGFVLDSNTLDAIEWMQPGSRSLILGTTNGIWTLQPTSLLDPTTPSSINLKNTNADRASAIRPILIDDVIVYMSRSKKRVVGVSYFFDRDSYVSDELSVINDEVTGTSIDYIQKQPEPNDVVWFNRSDGVLAALTYVRNRQVLGWHRHIVGGSFGTKNFFDASVTLATDTINRPSHGLDDRFGPVRLTTSTTLPVGLALATDYWIIKVDSDNFRLSLTEGGAIVDITAASSGGTHTITPASDAVVESIAVIPASDHDQMWLSVKRTINGSTYRSIEYMVDRWNSVDNNPEDMFFVDSGTTFTQSALTVATGGSVITQANPCVVTTTVAHGLVTGQHVTISGIADMVEANGTWEIATTSTTAFSLLWTHDSSAVDSTDWTAHVTGGTVLTRSVGGLDHLIGQTVQVLVEGVDWGDFTVSNNGTNGYATLDDTPADTDVIQVGLRYDADLSPMFFIADDPAGTNQGNMAKVSTCTLRLMDTIAGKIGPDELNLDTLPVEYTNYGGSPNIFDSKDVRVPVAGGSTRDPRIFVRQDRPYPMTVLSIIVKMREASG